MAVVVVSLALAAASLQSDVAALTKLHFQDLDPNNPSTPWCAYVPALCSDGSEVPYLVPDAYAAAVRDWAIHAGYNLVPAAIECMFYVGPGKDTLVGSAAILEGLWADEARLMAVGAGNVIVPADVAHLAGGMHHRLCPCAMGLMCHRPGPSLPDICVPAAFAGADEDIWVVVMLMVAAAGVIFYVATD